jgi:glycosyltransferase involved in cell wall biosynthesis
MSLVDHFIVHTAENARALAALAPRAAGRTSVIAMGPEKGRVSSGIAKAAARAKLGLGRSEKVVLFFGNIRPYKRLDVMLNAFELVRQHLPGSRLLVVGQPWTGSSEVERALVRARTLEGVTLRTEYVPESEVEAYFVAADVVACPYSGFEAQSGAASMAVAYGKALLVSKTGGLTSLVKDEKAIVPPGDALSLATALEAVLADTKLRQKLEQDSKRVARESSWDHVAAETASLYKRLVQTGKDVAA